MQGKVAFWLILFLTGSLLAICFQAYSLASPAASTGTEQPLVQKGKKTLYQRIITHPGAKVASVPGGVESKPLDTFTPLYVYERKNLNGEEWLRVSPSSNGTCMLGWIKANFCSQWDKALTLIFADRMGRDPALFFRSFNDLNRVVSSDNIRISLDNLIAGVNKPGNPLLATEPMNVAIPRKNFYLMPVFNYSDEYDNYNLRLLNTGIINPGDISTNNYSQQANSKIQIKNDKFQAGLVFILDTTISMGPYIERTKEFIHDAYNELEKSPIANDVSLAVVAYRNSTKYNQNIEYISKIISPFKSVVDRRTAEYEISSMDESKVSTHSFNEDAFAGIKSAIDQLDWSPFAIKIAVLVSDAGAIRNNDPYSSTGFNEKEMADLLAQKGIRLVVIHLQTAKGKKHNLKGVINQYKKLTSISDGNVKSAYIGLPVTDLKIATQQFAKIAEGIIKIIEQIIQKTKSGSAISKPIADNNKNQTPEDSARNLSERLGYAAYLEFAGQRENIAAPHLEEAWVADKDLDSLAHGKSTDTFIACVLLNKQQLDTMAKQIGILIDSARASRTTDSRGLFQRVISLSSQAVRDPKRMQNNPDSNLCSVGLLPEFLEGLPYKSEIMNLTENRWIAMSSQEQDELIYSLEAKIKLYKEYYNDVDNWISFGFKDSSESLYRVPLTSLP